MKNEAKLGARAVPIEKARNNVAPVTETYTIDSNTLASFIPPGFSSFFLLFFFSNAIMSCQKKKEEQEEEEEKKKENTD